MDSQHSITKTEEEWRQKLTEEQYHVMREKGTEPPGSGKYVKKTEDGLYHCVACGAVLFSSVDQFESKEAGLVGWPSFEKPENLDKVELRPDNTLDRRRTEVICKSCGSHLGHVFDAGDSKTGKHFCINSWALQLEKGVQK